MTAPRLEIDLGKIHRTTPVCSLNDWRVRGISVTGVTKATLGSPEIAGALAWGGRVLRSATPASRTSKRCVWRMCGSADDTHPFPDAQPGGPDSNPLPIVSFNTEIDVIQQALLRRAEGGKRTHGVVLMVELGDLREGIMPDALDTHRV